MAINCCPSYPCPICLSNTAGSVGRITFGGGYPAPVPQGWECPKCHSVYAPGFPSCTRCGATSVTTIGLEREGWDTPPEAA